MRPRLLLVLLLFFGLAFRGIADSPEDQYIRIYNAIQKADNLESTSPSEALVKFLEAQNELRRFQKMNPGWNPKIVNFRLDYIASRVSALSNQHGVAAQTKSEPPQNAPKPSSPDAAVTPPESTPVTSPAPIPASPAPVPAVASGENQVEQLTAQLRQLQADKSILEAKLKEALSSQPAAWDPTELVKANDKIKSLEKENDLLKVSIASQKTRAGLVPDSQSTVALAEANRKLAQETERAQALTVEKNALQAKLDSLIPGTWNAKNIEQTKKAIEDTTAKLSAEQEKTRKLGAEKDALEARLKSLSAESEKASALQAENEILKKQLAEFKSAPATPGKAANPARLAEAEAQIAALQSDKELLRLEKIALEGRVKQLSSGTAPVLSTPASPPTTVAAQGNPKSEEAMRIKLLERERDDLQKKLETALRELYGRKGRGKSSKVEEMDLQLAALRARLDVFEARQIPYSAEELALFKKPDPQIVANPAPAKSNRKSVNELPPGTSGLVAEAQRYFSARQYDKAEQNYLQVLNKDQKNVPTLANLALIQLQLNHVDDAEKNARKAVELAPDDAYSLSVLAQVKFRQEKFDDALDELSQAAKLEPQNAQVQNLLGLTLSQKGMRGPAETALRKAIQIEPGYADAHNNLAVVYVTQQPPLIELAKWHYQKALAGGNPHNPFLEKAFTTKGASESSQK